ncbi:MFS transporter [Viridibacillus sp. NPDC096237]|uniref:MFS transporter n=1 Tax=Viridibacillus sp. NPDC096237 TaxID=3390721 RepID=UPI003CFD543C
MWKKYSLLLSGIGVSFFGNWIYLIALNILVLDMTNSAAAVAGIYIVGPVAKLLTNFFAGSIIDRQNKRRLMILSDVIRGLLVLLVPFMGSIWTVYAILFIANMASSFFGPSSTFYITKFVEEKDRRRFNSIMSMLSSGSFLIGPALAGILIATVGTTICVVINAITFFLCAVCIYLLPNAENESTLKREPITLKMIMADWQVVKLYIKQDHYFIKIYLLFQFALMIALSLDSQEVTFIKQNLGLSNKMYGMIVSITGIGSIIGASVSAMLVKKISLQTYFAIGMLMTTVGYLLFYSSIGFWSATAAFIFLGFFMSFANSGYDTFYQKNVPTEIMGRFGSVTAMFLSILQISFTFIIGALAEWFSLQMVTIGFSAIAVLLSIILCIQVFQKPNQRYYAETS